jgi:superfamily II DNA or RNA helicase
MGMGKKTMKLRSYQEKAVSNVLRELELHRCVCLVAPTGSGKTVMAQAIIANAVDHGLSVLFLAHRIELIRQAANRIDGCGIIAPDCEASESPVQVASIQTLLARDIRPHADIIIWDECHHVNADTYAELLACYPQAKVVGLTATPQRADGRPLGDVFKSMVVAAQYSDLIEQGHLVRCRLFQPDTGLGDNLAQPPLEAYRRFADDSLAFGFARTIKQSYELAQTFCDSGIKSAVIEANTPSQERKTLLEQFSAGVVRVLWNVTALTEGVDVPQASTILMARKVGHHGLYMQMAGRILRPYAGKESAILIDLTGTTLKHGRPDEDQFYTLDGEGIKRTSKTAMRVCHHCGAVTEAYNWICPECGGELKQKAEIIELKYVGKELSEAFAGAQTDDILKRKEYLRLRNVAKANGYGLYWVQKNYKKLFGEAPIINDATDSEKSIEYNRLMAFARSKGYKAGFAAVNYKNIFGQWPARRQCIN